MPWVRIPCRWCRLCRHWRRIVLAYTAQALHRYSFSTVRIHPLRLTKKHMPQNYFTSSDPHCDKLFCHSFWQLIWKYICFLTCPLRSGSCGSHWDLELAVEARQCPEIWRSRLRSGSAHWDLASRLRSGGRKKGRKEGINYIIKKNRGAHLAGGERCKRDHGRAGKAYTV